MATDRSRRPACRSRLACGLLLALLWPFPGWALSDAEQRGRQIYREGVSPAGAEISAQLVPSGVSLPGAALPCVGCHGKDGRGRPEGGVLPSDITWSQLMRPFRVSPRAGTHQPTYDLASLGRAITQGLDPEGNLLDGSMPRYNLNATDLDDLLTYMRVLESDLDPGIDERHLILGTLIPAPALGPGPGAAVEQLLHSYLNQLNRTGGIYGRRLVLEVETVQPTEAWPDAAERLLQRRPLFALLAPVVLGQGRALSDWAERRRVPLIGPVGRFVTRHDASYRQGFYLLAGPPRQWRALQAYAAQKLSAEQTALAIVYPDTRDLREVENCRNEGQRHGWKRVLMVGYSAGGATLPAQVARLRGEVDAVLFMGEQPDLERWLLAAQAQDWTPLVFLTGAQLASPFALPARFKDRVFAAFPTLPVDLSAEGVRAFGDLHRRNRLSEQFLPEQLAAFAATRLLLEGLKRAGRDLSRDRFRASLEKLYHFETGVTPPLRFGTSRHLGSTGVYVVPLSDQAQASLTERAWIELPE